jgi:hypothetical protein
MLTSNYESLCHKVLTVLNAKTNNQAYYIGEGDLADWYVPVEELLRVTKTNNNHLKSVISLMKEGDEIGVITIKGSEHFYLKIKGILAIEGKKYKKSDNMLSHLKRIICM